MISTVGMPINTEEDKCPSCGKEEDVVEVCKHCGYEYKDEPLSFIDRCVIFLIISFAIWFIVVMAHWLLFNFDNNSLFEIIKGQWTWLKALRVF